jgi:hypothetical protein
MLHAGGFAFIPEACSQSAADSQPGVYLLQEQGASVAGEEASGEIGDNLAGAEVLKKHRGILTLCLAGVGSCCFCSLFHTKRVQKTNSRHVFFVIFSG